MSKAKRGLHKQLHQNKISMDGEEKLLKRQIGILKFSRLLNKQQKENKTHPD